MTARSRRAMRRFIKKYRRRNHAVKFVHAADPGDESELSFFPESTKVFTTIADNRRDDPLIANQRRKDRPFAEQVDTGAREPEDETHLHLPDRFDGAETLVAGRNGKGVMGPCLAG